MNHFLQLIFYLRIIIIAMDKITIITACYNETPDRIRYTLDSIVGQNYPSIENIIIDGGSRVDTIKALRGLY